MPNNIQILPDFIANQIAAGEVVQKPESVVKELVENSLDAGASEISVVVHSAGKKLIHIADNGGGMSKEDLELSVKRHATSKIRTQEDLERILTLGFRGEALASIASVAQIEIRTMTEGGEHGWQLNSDPTKEVLIKPFNTVRGTQLFVRNLFFNVPARRKFLRANLTEFRYISETMLRFALGNPSIRFVFYDEDRQIFDVYPEELIERITSVIGNAKQEDLLKVDLSNEQLKISGYLGMPHLAKLSKSGQFLYLNGRSIQSRALSHAVFSAFEHMLDKNQHPFFVIFIDTDPEKVDVNIHPQKHEVKFDDERFVYNTLREAAFKCLNENKVVPEINFREKLTEAPFEVLKRPEQDDVLVNRLTGEIIEQKFVQGKSTYNYNEHSRRDKNKEPIPDKSAFDALFSPGEKIQQNPNISRESLTHARYWQLHNKYIFVETDIGVMIVDQHNAHERVLYENAIKTMNREFSNSQELLFPITIHLEERKLLLLKELDEELKSLGFIYEINDKRVTIKSIPPDLIHGDEENSLKEILDIYEEFSKVRHTGKRDNIAASFSCKAAIKTGHDLSLEEMVALVNNLLKCNMPYVCPHGRPVVLEYTLAELDRRFKRTS